MLGTNEFFARWVDWLGREKVPLGAESKWSVTLGQLPIVYQPLHYSSQQERPIPDRLGLP